MIFIFLYLVFLIIVPQEWIPPFIDLPVDIILFPIWFIYLVSTGKTQEFTWKINDRFLLYFIVWLMFSYLANERTILSGSHAFYYTKWLVLYVFIVMTVGTARGVRSAAKILLILASFVAIEAINHRHSPDGLGWANNPYDWGGEVTEKGESGRVSWIGIFGGPGVFSVLFVSLLPFVLQYLFKPFSGFQKLLGLGLLSMFLLTIFYSGSRGGFLGTIAVIGIFGLLKSQVSITSIIKISVFSVLIFMLAPSHLTTMNDSSRSAQHRVEMWAAGSDMIESNPLFGVGRGNFAAWSGKLIAHNSAIEIMAELGFVGFFLWIGMIYWFFKTIYQYVNDFSDASKLDHEELITYSYIKYLGISLFGYLVCSMFVTLEYETFYILLALGSAAGNSLKKPLEITHLDYLFISAATIGFYLMNKIFVMWYLG